MSLNETGQFGIKIQIDGLAFIERHNLAGWPNPD
jgi:hypothetical protein